MKGLLVYFSSLALCLTPHFGWAGGNIPFLFSTIKAVNSLPAGTVILTFTPSSGFFNIYGNGSQITTLQNTGNATATNLTFNLLKTVSGHHNQFYIVTTTCGTSLAAGQSCSVTVDYLDILSCGCTYDHVDLTATSGTVTATATGFLYDDTPPAGYGDPNNPSI